MRHTKLKDDPSVRWREELVSDIILRQVASLSIDTCITFDRHGVSGHRNHISLYYAQRRQTETNVRPRTSEEESFPGCFSDSEDVLEAILVICATDHGGASSGPVISCVASWCVPH